MQATWFLASVTAFGAAQCAHEERAPAPAERAASALGAQAVREPAQEAPRTQAPARSAAPSFQTLVPGLSVLANERVDAEGSTHEWIVARIDLHQHRLQVRALGDSPFADLPADAGLLLAVNGGFFDPKLQASGLLLSGGTLLARERAGGGSGVLTVANRRARLLKRGEALPATTDFALQCGPRLIEPGGAIGIRSDDGQRAARTAACIREAGQELNLIVAQGKVQLGSGPGLLQLARWLSEPLAPGERSGCEAALNLDGGPSTAISVAGRPELFRPPLGPVPFALLVTQ